MAHYLVVMRDQAMWLYGPFESQKAAGDWGSKSSNNPADDPRWQTIELFSDPSYYSSFPMIPVQIIPPIHPMPD